MAEIKWPETVPVLGAKDMCIGPMSEGECGCLMEQKNRAFHPNGRVVCDEAVNDRANAALVKAHEQLETGVPDKNLELLGWRSPQTSFTVAIPKSLAARVWNRACAILGYVVNNPECTPSGKLKPAK